MESLPSLAALRTFACVARHLHFRRAAEALSVSHAAVSQHIRALEESLGVQLFTRSRGGVSFTPDGQRLARGIMPAFEQLADAVQRVGRGRSQIAQRRLRIALLPSLATCWLYERLPDWQATHPDLSLEIEASTRVTALATASAKSSALPEAAIRFGAGQWAGTQSEKLCPDWLIAVMGSQQWQASGYRERSAVHTLFAHTPLLRHESTAWAAWLKHAQLTPEKIHYGPTLHDAGVLLHACKAGQGIALIRRTLAADALAAGAIKQIHPLALPTECSNYLVYPAGSPSPAVVKLRSWLRKHMRASHFLTAPASKA
jgi:LysR family transcriptional regulator, glycine cleavage system transcriptional activator